MASERRPTWCLTALPSGCLQMMQDWLNHYKLDRKTLSAFAANAAAASNYEEWTLEQASRAVEDIVAKLVKEAGEGVGLMVCNLGAENSISLVQVSAHSGIVSWLSALLGFRCMLSAGQGLQADMLLKVRVEQHLMTTACFAIGASTPVAEPNTLEL